MPARHNTADTPEAAAQMPSPRAPARRRTAQRRRPRVSRLLSWLLASFIGFTSMAHAQLAPGALPTGGKVVVGSGQIVQGGNVMQIHQTSGRLGLDWQSFNIGSGATVEFRQPGADSVALNRVLGNSGSEIYGNLKANGQVFLTNPNGILFAPGAKVDVGGLVASTLDLSQEDFASGRYLFTATGAGGEVVNRGNLNANAGGYLALFGNRVSNEGQISVNAGSVVLASGRAATVSISGSGLISAVVSPGAAGSVANSGSISADGSVVTLSARSAEAIASSLVNNSGIIRAYTIVEKGGEVWITGDRAVQTGRIEVDASQGLAAGKVTVKGDMSKGSVEVGGSISARSLDGSGAGGTVETSAAQVKVAADARVDTRGKAGAYGTWTIDPTDFTVGAGSGTQSESGIGATTLSANLELGSVVLATSSNDPASGAQPGDLRVNAAVNWSADTTLRLQSTRDIQVNARITATGDAASLILDPGSRKIEINAPIEMTGNAANLVLDPVAGGRYSLASGAKITLSGSNPSLNIGGLAYTVINGLGAEGSTTGTDLQGMNGNLSGRYALGSDIDASATAGWSAGFTPVGDGSYYSPCYYCYGYYKYFTGTFDGLGHSISGLQITQPAASSYVGLFGFATQAAIRNVELLGGRVDVSNAFTMKVGALFGYGESVTIDNVHSSMSVSAIQSGQQGYDVYVGGLFGDLYSSYGGARIAVTNSSSSGSVYGEGYSVYAGGLSGRFQTFANSGTDVGRVDSSSASGQVTIQAGYRAFGGGLLGYLYAYNGSEAIAASRSNASGAVRAVVGYSGYSPYAYLGGLVGYNYYSTISDSVASGAVSADYSTNQSSGYGYLGGLVGYGYGRIIDSQASGAVGGTAAYYAGGLAGYFEHYGNAPFTLDNVSASGKVSASQANASYIGGLVGNLYGAARNGLASGDVVVSTSASYENAEVGGLIGYAYIPSSRGGIVDSVATGNVSGGYTAGGLLGELSMSSSALAGIVNSRASGDVRSGERGYYAGGLVGYYSESSSSARFSNAISGSHASGSVVGGTDYYSTYTGGLVGYFRGYRGIADSYATGDVTGRYTVGGLAGYFRNRANSTEGGDGGTGGIVRSFASGNVSLQDAGDYAFDYAGGLVGYLEVRSTNGRGIEDSYATGSVNASLTGIDSTANVGGLVGYQSLGTVTRAYSSGSVSATASTQLLGGLIGQTASGTVAAADSYWNTETSGQGSSAGGSGLTTAQMQQASSFSGWSIRSSATDGGETWRIYEGHTAPLLAGFLTPASISLADGSRAYDGTNSFATVGLSRTDGLGGTLDRPELVFAAISAKDVGSYAVDASQVYSSQLGYDLSVSGGAQLTITQRPLTLAGVVADKVYDGTTAAALAAGAQPSGLVAGEDLSVDTSAVTAIFGDKNAGTGKTVNVSGYMLADGVTGKASNYALANSSTTTASITPAPLTVGDFAATNREYDGSTAVAVSLTSTASLGGLFGTDSVALDLGTVTGTMADKNAGTGKAVTVGGVGLIGADAANYRIAGIDQVTVDIAKKTVTVNGITAYNKTYDGSATVSLNLDAATVDGVLAGDRVAPSSSYYYGLTGTMADKNAGTGKAVTVNGLLLLGPDAQNYTPQAAPITVDVAKRQTYVYAYDNYSYVYDSSCGCYKYVYQSNKVYDGTASATITLYANNSVDGALTVSAADISYDNRNAGTNKTITASGISLGGSDNVADNYILLNTSATYSGGIITPKALTVTGVTATNRAYDGTTNVVVTLDGATVDSAGIVTVGGITDDVSVSLPSSSGTVVGTIANKNFGNNKAVTVPGLALTGADANNYTLSGAGGVTVNISKKDLTATYTANDKVYDGSTQVKTAASSSDIVPGDDVTFYSNWYTSYYYYYSFYPYANLTGTGAKNVGENKPVSITYDYIFGNDAANYNFVNAGTGIATATVTQKEITPVLSVGSKVYDRTTTAPTTLNNAASGIASGYLYINGCYYCYVVDDVTLSTTTAANFDDKNVGNFKSVTVSNITLSGADAGNYKLTTTTATGTGSITAKPVTISGITATNRAYDGTNTVALTAGTVSSSGFITGDDIAVSLPSTGINTGTMANADVGLAKPVTITGLSLTGNDAGNYTIDGSSTTVDIGKRAVTVAYTGVNREYNGGVSATVVGTSSDIVASDVASIYFTQNAVFTGSGAKNVGTGKSISISNIALSGYAAANYELLTTTASATADITPRLVTINYIGQNRVYNGVSNVSASVTGSSNDLIVTDRVGFSQTARFATDGSAGINKTIEVSNIALTGAEAYNYQLVSNTATTTATILPRAIGVTGITATDRVYDGTREVAVNAAGARVDTTSVIAGDDVTVTLPSSGITTGLMADRHSGIGKAVTVSGIEITGTSASNYVLADGSGATVTIAPLAVTANYTAADKVYDGTATAAISANSVEFLPVDSGGVFLNATGTFTDGKNVGIDKAVAITGGFLSGSFRTNYTLSNPTGSTTASISARTLNPSYGGGTKVYDGSAAAPVVNYTSGVVSGDQVTFGQTAVFTEGSGGKNVGSGKAISITGITLGGFDASNYALASDTASAFGSVTPKPITVGGLTSVTATDRDYDGTTIVQVLVPAGVTLTPNSNDIVAGDTVTVNVPTSGITTGTVATKNVGTGKAVTVTGLSLQGTDAGNYSIAGTAGITVDISRKALTASYTGVNRVYDGTSSATVTGSSSGIVTGDSVGISGSGVFTDGKNVGTAKPIDIQSAGLFGFDAGNYTLLNTTGSATADVTARTVTASYVGGSRVYDGSDTAPVTGSAGFISGDNVGLSQTAVFSGGKSVGNGKAIDVIGIQLTGDDSGNYQLSADTATTTGSITPKTIGLVGLTGITATDRVYDGTRNVNVTIESSGTVTVNEADIVTGDAVTVSVPSAGVTTGTVANKNVGTGKAVTVTGLGLAGLDAGNYVIAAAQGVTVNITAKSLTASYSGVNRTYDATTAASVTGTSLDILAGDSVTITGTGVFDAGKTVGTAKSITVQTASLGGDDAGNYSLANPTGSAAADITAKSVTASYVGGSRVYDGSTNAPVTGSASGLIAGDNVSLTQVSAVFANKNVGTNKAVTVTGIALDGSDAANYLLTNTSASTTASVTPKSVAISGLTGVTATDRVYDGSNVVAVTVAASSGSVTLNAGDIVTGDVVGIGVPTSGTTTGTMADKNVGTGKAVSVAGLGLTGDDAANYVIANSSAVTVNITPKDLTATYTGVNKVYDGTATATVAASSSDIVAGDSVTIAASGVFSGGKAVGSGKTIDVQSASLGSTDAGNYNLLNPTGSATADITRKAVTASFSGGTRVYDGTGIAPVTSNALGLIAGDAVSLTQTATFSDKNVGRNKAVSVTGVALTGEDAGNYNLLTTSGSALGTVTPRPVTIAGLTGVTATDRAYDGTKVVQVTISATGPVAPSEGDIIQGDDVTVTAPAAGATTGLMADKNIGTGKAVAVTGLQLNGKDAGNYTVTATQGVTVNITPKQITASYAGVNKVYDGTTVATVIGNSSDIVAGDSVGISGSGVFTGDKNAGVGKAIEVQTASIAGFDAANYALANPTGTATADITPKAVTASYTGGSRVYDQSVAAPVAGTSADFIAGDKVALTESAVFTGPGAKNAGTGKVIAVNNIALTGDDAANYALQNFVATATGTITPRPISVAGLSAVSAVDRVYDGTTVVQVNVSGSQAISTGDILAGDDVTLSLPAGASTGSMADKNAGQGKPVTVASVVLSGTDAGNYKVTGTPGVTVNIAPLAISVTGVAGVDRVYDGSTSVAVDISAGSVVGAISGDSVTVADAGASGTVTSKNVGSGKPVTVSGLGLSGSDAGNYAVASVDGVTVNITPAPVTVTANSLNKVYGEALSFAGNEFSAAGLVAGETIGQVTLSSSGAAATAHVKGSAYAVTAADARGGSFDPSNYSFSYVDGNLTVTPRPVTVAANSFVRFSDEPNPASFGFSTSVSGLVGGDSLSAVLVDLPASSASAPGGSVFDLMPSGGVFASGDPANYALSYTGGLLVVLPKPPRIDDVNVDGPSGGEVSFLIQVDPQEVEKTNRALERATATSNQTLGGPAPVVPPPMQAVRQAEGLASDSAAALAAALSGDSRGITLTALRGLPLLSFSPQLRRQGPDGEGAPPTTPR